MPHFVVYRTAVYRKETPSGMNKNEMMYSPEKAMIPIEQV